MSDAKKVPPVQISSDGITVWINGSQGLIARFGRMGIDIHCEDKGECLFCTHCRVTAKDWDLFVVKVMECYGIKVEQGHRPRRFSSGEFNVQGN